MNRGQRRARWLARRRQGAQAVTATSAPAPGPPSVRVHVEELVLHGFAPGDRRRIGDAVLHELTRLLTEQGVPPQLARAGETERLDADSFALAPGAGARAVGVRTARAVYGGAKP
jgi:hypothetical protein